MLMGIVVDGVAEVLQIAGPAHESPSLKPASQNSILSVLMNLCDVQ